MKVVVVGGGIIGASCAALLAERGADVTVLDAGEPRFGTSMANAGHIVVSHCIPMAAPGMVKQGLRSLINRDGAFALSRDPGSGTLRWLAGFARHCTASNVALLQPGLDQLLRRSSELLRADSHLTINSRGLWQVYTSSPEKAAAEAEHLRHHGVSVRDVTAEELRAEPGLTGNVVAATELTEDLGVDPTQVWTRMRHRSEQAGATWTHDVVTDLRGVSADIVVLAAGAWSPHLTRSLGVDLPIRAAKGYSVTIAGVEQMPSRPMLLMDQRTALNPLGDMLRLSARYEITRADDRAIDGARIRALIKRARQAVHLPVHTGEVQPWTGVRPATIDGAPYIGFLSRRTPVPVLVATGHGMIGTAMAAGTADLVTRLAFDESITDAEGRLSPARLFS